MPEPPSIRTVVSMNHLISEPVTRGHDVGMHAILAAGSWGVFGLSAIYREFGSDGEEWRGAYMLYTVLLLLAIVAALVSVASATGPKGVKGRPLATCLCALAAFSAVIAWAQLLWAVLLAVAVATLAATGSRLRREAFVVAAGPLGGLLVSIVGVNLKLGDRDSYGDYPTAQTAGVVFGSLLTAAALVHFAWRARRMVPIA